MKNQYNNIGHRETCVKQILAWVTVFLPYSPQIELVLNGRPHLKEEDALEALCESATNLFHEWRA